MLNKLLTLLLLPALCMAQPFEQNSPCFNPDEISKLYQLGKKYEFYKKEYPKRVEDIVKLDSIVQANHVSLLEYIDYTQKKDAELRQLYDTRQELAVKSAKKWGFREWLGFISGCLTSGWLGYQIGK